MGEAGGSILVLNGRLGWPFMPELLLKLRLEHIIWCFDILETWLGCPEFRHTEYGVERPSRMLARA